MKILSFWPVWILAAVVAPAPTATNATQDGQRAEEEVRRLNAEEVEAFLKSDPKIMAQLWSDDFVVTNPLNKFVNKQQVLGMVGSGFLVITSYDRQVDYILIHGDTVIVAGRETVVWGEKYAERRESRKSPFHRNMDEIERTLAGGGPAREYYSSAALAINLRQSRPAIH
jgi:Domain of unknown function (DUF4440)